MDELNIIAFISPIASSFVIWYIQRRYEIKSQRQQQLQDEERNRIERERAERNETRRKESILILKSIKSIGKLSYVNAKALKDGRVNGCMEEALLYYKETNEEMNNFLQEQAVNHI
jgi:hypothetical protein